MLSHLVWIKSVITNTCSCLKITFWESALRCTWEDLVTGPIGCWWLREDWPRGDFYRTRRGTWGARGSSPSCGQGCTGDRSCRRSADLRIKATKKLNTAVADEVLMAFGNKWSHGTPALFDLQALVVTTVVVLVNSDMAPMYWLAIGTKWLIREMQIPVRKVMS